MKALKDKVNVVPPGGDYPYGDVKDNPGNNTGTPVNRDLLGDLLRNIEKIVAESGIIPNGLDDNEANGYQVYEAMRITLKPYKSIFGYFTGSGGLTVLQNDTGVPVTLNEVGYGYYEINAGSAIYTAGKTSVIVSNTITIQGSTTLVTVGGKRVSDTKVIISCMAFFNMNSGGSTASGVNVGVTPHVGPLHFEIRIFN